MLRKFLRAHLTSRFLFYIEGNRVVTGNDFDLVKKAAESFVQIKPLADVSKCYMLEINRLTGSFLMFYFPSVTPENKIAWKEKEPTVNLSAVKIVSVLWFNFVAAVKNIGFKLYRGILIAWSALALIINVFVKIISAPLVIGFGLFYIYWVSIWKRSETMSIIVNGDYTKYFTDELKRGHKHMQVISIILFILFLCWKYFK